MLFDKYRYVVVEGPIGVGKTSLARRLAEHYEATALLEKPEENPFWHDFMKIQSVMRCLLNCSFCFSVLMRCEI